MKTSAGKRDDVEGATSVRSFMVDVTCRLPKAIQALFEFSHLNHVEGVYIIKPQEDTRWRVMRYKGGKPPLMICTVLRAVLIYQACGLDKPKEDLSLVAATQSRVLISALLRSSVSRGSDSPPGCHSLPLPFKSSVFIRTKQKRSTLCAPFPVCCGQ